MDERLSQEAVENLVTQFSSALDFYRELVQNAIDAGSSSVEVWTEFIEPDDGGAEGVIAMHVDDFGEGMNEEIIDDQLTQLFSSAKEDDLTKIGKFGIGFVSVFAMKPKAVLVHTGRAGEYWEVLFHEDRSFTKTRVEAPVEGTQITLFVSGDYARYRDLVEGSRATLVRWCAHSDTEITYEDRSARPGDDRGLEPINAPFEAAGECGTLTMHAGGTEVALAYNDRPSYGFYNKGLALAVSDSGEDVMGSHAARFSRIAFKIKSRWLEHTLSRETVMRDDNFEKAMAIVHEAASGPLRSGLLQALAAVARTQEWTLAATSQYRRLLTFLAVEPTSAWTDEAVLQAPIIRTVQGQVLSLAKVEELCGRDDRVYVAADPSPLTQRLSELGIPVLLSDRMAHDEPTKEDPTTRLLVDFLIARRNVFEGVYDRLFDVDRHGATMDRIVHPERVLLAVHPVRKPEPRVRELVIRAAELLDKVSAGYKEIVLGTVEALDDDVPMFVLGRKVASLMAKPPGARYERGRFEKPRALVNRQHPHFQAIEAMAEQQPEMAAYCLAKSLLLEEDRNLDLDIRLVEHATKSARRRAR